MASSTVRPPRPARVTREAPDSAEDGAPAPRPAARALRFLPPERRAVRDRRFGVGLSVALHVLLLVVLVSTDVVRLPDLATLLEEPVAGDGSAVVYLPIEGFPGPRTSATPTPVEGEVAASIRVTAPTTGVAAAPPAIDDEPSPADVVGGSGSGTGASTGAPGSGVERFNRVVEALRPRALDPRLRPGSIDALRTDHERAALRAYARIRALNDSIMAEMAAGERAMDWTWTDEQGRRWGISPGKLHLGGITIPLPISTAPSREDRDLMREWAEIQAQAEQGAIDETFDDRVEAIRARRDAERRE